MPKGRPPKAKVEAREFAILYVNGPDGVKGVWEECERRLGRKVDANAPYVREMVIAEGGFIPDKMPMLPEPPIELDLSKFALAVNEADSDDDWAKLADQIRPTALGIMTGEIKASAAQTALIKTIWDRAYGKVSATKEEKIQASGVIILPALGERSTMFVCPVCKYAVEQQHPKEIKEDA